MSAKPSTSKDDSDWVESERSKLLHQALSQAGATRAQQQKKSVRPPSQPQCPGEFDAKAEKENMKRKIREHPLMAVAKLLFEKCEEGSLSKNPESFLMDDVIKLFASLTSLGVSASTNDSSVDTLMWDTIIVLRTQLAELQKVSTLSSDFYNKYSVALRRRVSHETLVGSCLDSDEETERSTPELESSTGRFGSNSLATLTTASGTVSIPVHVPPHNPSHVTTNVTSTTPSPAADKKIPKFDFTSIQRSTVLHSSSTNNSLASLLPTFSLPETTKLDDKESSA